MNNLADILNKNRLWSEAHEIHKETVRDFYRRAGIIMKGSIELKPFDSSVLEIEKNLFSVIFTAIIKNLGIDSDLIQFYTLSVHCMRALVTGCDNILDNEYKEVIPFRLGEEGKMMKSVFMIMTADRIISGLALEKFREGVISYEKASQLSISVIRVLTDSGMEEGEEEEFCIQDDYPEPDIMIGNYLYRKTGTLFEAPINLLIEMGEISDKKAETSLTMLSSLGLGCQLLDEISDFSEDILSGRLNMVASLMRHGKYRIPKHEINNFAENMKQNAGKNTDIISGKSGKAFNSARNECFKLASVYFLKAGKMLPETIPGFTLNQFYSLAGFIKKIILKDDDSIGDLF